MFKPMKLIKEYLASMTMHYDGLLGGFRLLGAVLVELLGGKVHFNIVGALGMDLETELTSVLVNVKGVEGRGAERAYGFKQILPSDVDI